VGGGGLGGGVAVVKDSPPVYVKTTSATGRREPIRGYRKKRSSTKGASLRVDRPPFSVEKKRVHLCDQR